MSDDMDGRTPQDEGPQPASQPGAVMAPPPPPPAPPATGEQPPRPEGRRGGLVGGLVLIAIGAILLVNQLFPWLEIGRLWPVILIVMGIGIIFRRRP